MNTEQITKEPTEILTKTKNPGRIEAGKRLALYQKKAKLAMIQEKNPDGDDEQSSSSWMPEISLTTALTLVGITLTALDLYFRWNKNNKQNITPTKPKIVYDNEVEPVVNSKIPVPRIGME